MSLGRTGLLALLLLGGCKVKEDGLTVLVTAADEALLRDGVAFVGDARLHLSIVEDPKAELGRREGAVVAVTGGTSCAECYRLEGSGTLLEARGGGLLGKQYALWHALELLGYRFVHPRYAKTPTDFTAADPAQLGLDFAPDVDVRRGLHLHTLHPIEPMFDFWLPGDEDLDGAKRTIDFLIKNRGNYVQWAALDDILKTAAKVAPWQQHTRAITGYAHAHGVKTGVALQLFGMSNLQNAFDLVDEDLPDNSPEMERRLHLLLDGNGFDTLNLSFGEFFGADPARFVSQVDAAYAASQVVQPGVELTATIHVGNYDNLRVTYQGQTLLYYFLVQFANPAIVSWVHSTMYFNLYEPTGGAYEHQAFDEHRDYLEARLRAGTPAGYFPESAYWVAFDINVPTYLPLYVRSRQLDLVKLNQAGRLHDHVEFSSGFEWGYWMNDALTLRMNYGVPASWQAPVESLFAAWGAQGAKAADVVTRLGEAQHRALILEKLAAYVAGRDQIIDAGDALGIFSQPDRPEFSELRAADAATRAQFKADVLDRLEVHAAELEALATEVDGFGDDEPVLSELKDGVQVTAARVRYIHDVYAAVLTFAETGSDGGGMANAQQALDRGHALVAHRRRHLWDPDAATLIHNNGNPTFYQYGYLREADTLCFWERERAQARNVIFQEGIAVPGCVL